MYGGVALRPVFVRSVVGLLWSFLILGCGQDPTDHIVQLKSLDADKRIRAANALIRFEADEVVPLLITEAKSEYIRVRFEAVWLLGRFRDDRGIPVLIDALGDRSPNVAARAALALGLIRSVRALPHLLGYVRDPSEVTRQHVLSALGACHSYDEAYALSDSAHRVILSALTSSKAKWRIAALQSLREFGYKDGIDVMMQMVYDPSVEVRHVAVQALGHLASGKHIPPDTVDDIVSITPAQRSSIVDLLLESLVADEFQSIRTKAVRALAAVGNPRAVSRLEMLVSNGTDEDQREARRALSRLEMK